MFVGGSVEKGNLGVPQLPGQGCSFHSFKTNTYRLSFMESPSGIKVLAIIVSILLRLVLLLRRAPLVGVKLRVEVLLLVVKNC